MTQKSDATRTAAALGGVFLALAFLLGLGAGYLLGVMS